MKGGSVINYIIYIVLLYRKIVLIIFYKNMFFTFCKFT